MQRTIVSAAAPPAAEFFVALKEGEILMLGNGEFDRSFRLIELIDRFSPGEALDLRCFQDFVEFLEAFGKGRAPGEIIRQIHEILDARCLENGTDLGKGGIHALQVAGQAIGKKADWFVTGIQFHGGGYVSLHGVGLAVVADAGAVFEAL